MRLSQSLLFHSFFKPLELFLTSQAPLIELLPGLFSQFDGQENVLVELDRGTDQHQRSVLLESRGRDHACQLEEVRLESLTEQVGEDQVYLNVLLDKLRLGNRVIVSFEHALLVFLVGQRLPLLYLERVDGFARLKNVYKGGRGS